MKSNTDVSKELVRLEGMLDGKMKVKLRNWIEERCEILRQIMGPGEF